MVHTLTITAVARRAGLRTSAIRYYESVGLLPAPGRVSGHRRYDPDVLPRLALIAVAQQMGFTIAEIGRSCTASRQTRLPRSGGGFWRRRN